MLIGLQNKRSGNLFEELLTASCQFYLEKGYAHIEKTPEPFHLVRRNNKGMVEGYYEKAAQPDFKGVLCDGSGIMFEAKHTDTDKIKQNVITEEQWKSLDIYEKLNAKCFVMVSMGLTGFYRVPWADWKQMKEKYNHKYMNEEELKPYKLIYQHPVIKILDGIAINDKNGT